MENNTKAFARIMDHANPYFESEKELTERVKFASNVIMNTLRKFPREFWPEELTSLTFGSNAKITGFEFRTRDWNNRTQPKQESEELTHKDELHFYIIGAKSWQDSSIIARQVSLPASLLFKDPMAIAQYARKLIRAKQEQLRLEKLRNSSKRLQEIAQKIKNLEQECTKLEEARTELRSFSQLSQEKADKKKAKLEKRRAAKLLKADS